MHYFGMIMPAVGRAVEAAVKRFAAWRGGRDRVSAKPQGHFAACAAKWNPFKAEKDNGKWRRKSPSNTWIRTPEQSIITVDADYKLTDRDRDDAEAGRALFFTGKALAKAELICERQGGLEILWYWTARRSTPWVIDGLVLPDDQYATSGTCYAAPEEVLAVSRRARRIGRLIQGAGHSHGRLPVFASRTDLELMSQLAAERVGFASQVDRSIQGAVEEQSAVAPAAGAPDSQQSPQTFEVTFDKHPETWLRFVAPAGLAADDFDVELDRLQRHQVSFFTTHNAHGDHYFPVHHVTSCFHCGTRLEDYSAENVRIRVIGPKRLSEEEENDLIAELDAKAPRGGFFREPWGWSRSSAGKTVELDEPADDRAKSDDEEEEKKTPTDFFVYRHGQRVGSVTAAVLEEAAYRCPALASALGWRCDEPRETLQEELGDAAAEARLEEDAQKIDAEPDDEAVGEEEDET